MQCSWNMYVCDGHFSTFEVGSILPNNIPAATQQNVFCIILKDSFKCNVL